MIRPLAEEGRLKLAQDMAQLELSLQPLLAFAASVAAAVDAGREGSHENTMEAAAVGSAADLYERARSGGGLQCDWGLLTDCDIASLGPAYDELRALRPLVFTDSASLLSQAEVSVMLWLPAHRQVS